MTIDYTNKYSDVLNTAKHTDQEAAFKHMHNGEIEELSAKYFVLKGEDIGKFLSKEERYQLHELSTKISDGRKTDGKHDNDYVILNLNDDIDLSVWSPILKRIKEIEQSHLIPIKVGKNGGTYGHDNKPDKVKDIAVSIVNAILNESPMVKV